MNKIIGTYLLKKCLKLTTATQLFFLLLIAIWLFLEGEEWWRETLEGPQGN